LRSVLPEKITEEIKNVKQVLQSFSENGMVLEESIYKNNEYNGLAILKIRKVM
jgi:hypothetical protein